jgi:hypothetical protein
MPSPTLSPSGRELTSTSSKLLSTSLSHTSFVSPPPPSSSSSWNWAFPPLQYQCDIALARFNCNFALAAPDTRRLQGHDPHPDSLEQCTRAALLRLGRPSDYDHFVLPASTVTTKTDRPVRTYARSRLSTLRLLPCGGRLSQLSPTSPAGIAGSTGHLLSPVSSGCSLSSALSVCHHVSPSSKLATGLFEGNQTQWA